MSETNTIVMDAREEMRRIEEDARVRKDAVLERARTAKGAIAKRIAELDGQMQQLDAVLGEVKGTRKVLKIRPCAELNDIRSRVYNWMKAHAGTKYSGKQLRQEFGELEFGASIRSMMKKEIKGGLINMEKGRGTQRLYYVPVGGIE